MAWPERKTEFTVEDVEKVLGMKPADLKTKLDEITALKDGITKLEGQSTALEEIKNSLAALKTKVDAAPARTQSGNNGGNNNGSESKDEPEELDFLMDAEGSTRKLIEKETAGVKLLSLQTNAELVYNSYRSGKRDFGVFEEEIRKEWDKIGPQHKTNPQVLLDNIYNMVRGRNLENVMTDTNKREGKFFIESGGTSQNNSTSNSDRSKLPADKQLTAQELEVCVAMGVTPEKYLERKNKRLEGVVEYV